MIDLAVFRNTSGDLGVIQKDGGSVSFFVAPKNSLHSVSGGGEWNRWIQQVDGGYLEGDKDNLTAESISYFLNRYAETISIKVIELHKVENPGGFYSRIARENIKFNYVTEEFLQDVRAYQNIQMALDALFNYIEPSAVNLKAYGHKIRELLILACTEVEYLLLKTLTDNGYQQKDRYSTFDYVNCRDVLKLDKFEVSLVQYPKLKHFKPFDGWDSSSPTKSLPWYNAYNSVKHNRSDNITQANLEHLLDAASAIHVLLESQYGKNIFQRWSSRTDDRSMFSTVVMPTWLCSEVTAPVLKGGYEVGADWTHRREYFKDNPL